MENNYGQEIPQRFALQIPIENPPDIRDEISQEDIGQRRGRSHQTDNV